MIIITGAAGFIGSCLVSYLNQNGIDSLIVVDDFTKSEKWPNLTAKKIVHKVDRTIFFDWIKKESISIDFFIHIGARTDTAEFDRNILHQLNTDYSKKVWEFCTQQQIPLIYASSAATYGAGENGYDDNETILDLLKPLNPYGDSKHEFDKWAVKQTEKPPFWAGLKFFNVYGPNEYHKSRMASVIFHTFEKVSSIGKMQLFKSHHPDFEDGLQLRDFIYVKDILNVISFLMKTKPSSGIYNLGTGHAESFLALAHATFDTMGIKRNIEFIDIPLDIRSKYQYFTEAKMDKLRNAGYSYPFYTLQEGIFDYVSHYLIPHLYF